MTPIFAAPRARLTAVNSTRESSLGDAIRVADTSLSRFWGLLGKGALSEGEGLLIQPSNGVHTLCMRFDIDVLLLDRAHTVLTLYRRLRPFRMTAINWKAACALELPAGLIDASGTEVGDTIAFTSAAVCQDSRV